MADQPPQASAAQRPPNKPPPQADLTESTSFVGREIGTQITPEERSPATESTSLAVNHHHTSKPKPPPNQPVSCFNRKPKEQREKREQKANEKKREKFSEEMRRERKKS
jgi:hypothetical protein